MRTLYQRYQSHVRGQLFRLLGPDSEADDIVQVVFSRAFAALDHFQEQASLGTWLYRIAANTAANVRRQRTRRARVQSALCEANEVTAHAASSSRVEVRRQVTEYLDQLGTDQRNVFMLYHYEGLTLQEIAQHIDTPLSTVGDRLSRARARLAELVRAA